MSTMRRLARLWRNVFRRERVEQELDEEIASYLEALIREKVAAGMTHDDARRAARIELGGADQVKEEVRDARAGALFEQIVQDARYGLRTLRGHPAFTVVALATLALGIGANTAIFSVVHAVLLRPLPYPEPDRLIMLIQSDPQRGLTSWPMSQANFAAYREQSRSFEHLAVYTRAGYNVSGAGESARLQAAAVSAEFFDVFRAAPLLGRTFRPGDDAPGSGRTCVLSHGEWERRFGADRGVVGRTLLLNNVPTEIVGVMPKGFAFPDRSVQLWVSLDVSRERKSPFYLAGVGRLRPGASVAEAQAETTGILKATAAGDTGFIGSNAVPPPDSGLRTDVRPLHEAVTGRSRAPLLVLLGSVGLVLLIACANVANLLLARGVRRSHEISVRFALGATSGRVMRQLMTECLLLGGLGCAAGLAVAAAGLRIAGRLPPGGIARLDEAHLDAAVLGVCVVSGLAATTLFGLVPAWRTSRAGFGRLGGGGRSTDASGSRRMTGALVAVQFALSLVLLVGTGLLLKSFQRLLAVDPGFDAARLLTMSVYLPPQNPAGYAHPFAPPTGDEGRRTARFYGSLIESVLRVRGVRAAGLVSALPLSGDADSDGTVVEGHEPPGDAPVPVTQIFRTSPGYFRAMGITLVRGRDFSDHDREGSMPVAIVDDTLARRYWPDGDAIGKRIRYSWDTEPNAWKTIVGVVSGIRAQTLADGMEPHLYLPFAHEPLRSMSLVVRTETDPAAAAGAVREALREVDPGVPAYAVRSMEETIGGSLAPRKITSLLLAAFAAISLLLSAAGIYGVMSLEVAGRLKELAIRLALGARPVEVFGLVIGRGARLAAAGVAAGVAGALAVTRLLEGLLFEVTPADPAVFASVVVVLAVVAVLGCAIPGRRASRVDPIVTLRND